MIKINEDENKGNGKKGLSTLHQGKIRVTLDNEKEKTFDRYPIVIKSKVIEHLTFKIQKAIKIKLHNEEKGGIVEKVLEKAKDVKDKMMDTTKDITEKTKDVAATQQQESKPISNEDKTEKQESATNNGIGKRDDLSINRK